MEQVVGLGFDDKQSELTSIVDCFGSSMFRLPTIVCIVEPLHKSAFLLNLVWFQFFTVFRLRQPDRLPLMIPFLSFLLPFKFGSNESCSTWQVSL